jgi:hypothetical protein
LEIKLFREICDKCNRNFKNCLNKRKKKEVENEEVKKKGEKIICKGCGEEEREYYINCYYKTWGSLYNGK